MTHLYHVFKGCNQQKTILDLQCKSSYLSSANMDWFLGHCG